MKSGRNKGFLYMLLSFLFLYLHFNLVGLGLLYFSFMNLKRHYSHPFRKVIDMIKKDSLTYGAVIPQDEDIQKRIIEIYFKFEKVIQNYPLVKEEVGDIIKSFWLQVSYNVDKNTWNECLFKLESLRILPNEENLNDFNFHVNKLKDSFKCLEEAQFESNLRPVNK